MIKESISINNKNNEAFGPGWEKASQSAKGLLKFLITWHGEMERIIIMFLDRNKNETDISELAKQCLMDSSAIGHSLDMIAKKQINTINTQNIINQINQFNFNWKNLKIELGKYHEEYLNFIEYYPPHYFISNNFEEIINEINKFKKTNIEENIKNYYPNESIVRNYILSIANSGITGLEKYAEIISKQIADENTINESIQEIFSRFYSLLNKMKEEREKLLEITEPLQDANEKRYALEAISMYANLLSILESISEEIKDQEKIKIVVNFLNLQKTIANNFKKSLTV